MKTEIKLTEDQIYLIIASLNAYRGLVVLDKDISHNERVPLFDNTGILIELFTTALMGDNSGFKCVEIGKEKFITQEQAEQIRNEVVKKMPSELVCKETLHVIHEVCKIISSCAEG